MIKVCKPYAWSPGETCRVCECGELVLRVLPGTATHFRMKTYGNEADHQPHAQDQGRQDHTRAQEAEKVSISEDRSSQEATRQGS